MSHRPSHQFAAIWQPKKRSISHLVPSACWRLMADIGKMIAKDSIKQANNMGE